MFIELTGTGGASTNLIVPANKKLYFIYNNSTGAVTVKVSGQTGVSVPATAKVVLVSNGTDVIVAQNYIPTLISPTISNATLTGTPVAPTAAANTNTTQIATTAFVTTGLQAAYPVGSIYLSTVSTNPNTLFGFGTWVTFGSGRMLISQDGTYAAGSTGGAATTTLITANLPSHTHTFSATTDATDLSHTHNYGSSSNWGSGSANSFDARNSGSFTTNGANSNMNHTHTLSGTTGGTGSGTAATTISPYIAVYMWNRTV
jgi:microcystin-dependent protein